MNKRDEAWARYVQEKKIKLDGRSHTILASDLKKIAKYEPRLLTRLESPDKVPQPLREKGYCILAIENGTYLLSVGDVFAKPQKHTVSRYFDSTLKFPLYTSGRGTGESEYLDYAFNSGILQDFLGEPLIYQTIRGRERTDSFSFKVSELGAQVNVCGVQIEVDGGYETPNSIALVEAKIGRQDFFNIRQLYYPYRHFRDLVPNKRVRPVFFEYDLHDATYTFHEYEFLDFSLMDSLHEMKTESYRLSTRKSYTLDALLDERYQFENSLVPQADDLNKVLETLVQVYFGNNTVQGLAEYFDFSDRQSRYYTEAAYYLGLLQQKCAPWELSDMGLQFVRASPIYKTFEIAKIIINSWFFLDLIKVARSCGTFTDQDIQEIISNSGYSGDTVKRRSQTIHSWLRWLCDEIGVFRQIPDGYKLA